jgi:hypothetical protein
MALVTKKEEMLNQCAEGIPTQEEDANDEKALEQAVYSETPLN